MIAIEVMLAPRFGGVFVRGEPQAYMFTILVVITEQSMQIVAIVAAVAVALGLFHCAANACNHGMMTLPPTHPASLNVWLDLDHRRQKTHCYAVESRHKQQLLDREQLAVKHYIVAQGPVAEGRHQRQLPHSSGVVDVHRLRRQLHHLVNHCRSLLFAHLLLHPLFQRIVDLGRNGRRQQQQQHYDPSPHSHSVSVVCGVTPSTRCTEAPTSTVNRLIRTPIPNVAVIGFVAMPARKKSVPR